MDEVDYTLTIGSSSVGEGYWILDSCLCRHLVNNMSMLEEPDDYVSECVAADERRLQKTSRGSAVLTTTLMVTDVCIAENLERNIISYVSLEAKGCGLSY